MEINKDMNKKEIRGLKNVLRALLAGYPLESGGLVISLSDGFLRVFETGIVLNLDLNSTKFTRIETGRDLAE